MEKKLDAPAAKTAPPASSPGKPKSSKGTKKSTARTKSKEKFTEDVADGVVDVLDILCAGHGTLLEPLILRSSERITDLATAMASGNTPTSVVEHIDNDSLIWSAVVEALQLCEPILSDVHRNAAIEIARREVVDNGLRPNETEDLTPAFAGTMGIFRFDFIGAFFGACEIIMTRSSKSAPALRYEP